MRYYRYVDIDYKSIADQLRGYIIEKNFNSFWNIVDVDALVSVAPNLPLIFQPLNLTIDRISVIVVQHSITGIHIDSDICNSRINLPILNCDKSQTKFFINHGEIITHRLPDGARYFNVDPQKCEHVDSCVLDRPAVLNVSQPHQIVTTGDLPRISLSIRFKENIDYLLND